MFADALGYMATTRLLREGPSAKRRRPTQAQTSRRLGAIHFAFNAVELGVCSGENNLAISAITQRIAMPPERITLIRIK